MFVVDRLSERACSDNERLNGAQADEVVQRKVIATNMWRDVSG
jgi:hypothetical protein